MSSKMRNQYQESLVPIESPVLRNKNGKAALKLKKCDNQNNSGSCGASLSDRKSVKKNSKMEQQQVSISHCKNHKSCTSLLEVLESFNVPFSEDQVWAIVFQFICLYRNAIIYSAHHHQNEETESSDDDDLVEDQVLKNNRRCQKNTTSDSECGSNSDKSLASGQGDDSDESGDDENFNIKDQHDHLDYQFVPASMHNFRIHRDGSVHVSYLNEDLSAAKVSSLKQILMKLGIIFYHTLDFNLPDEEERLITPHLKQLICSMVFEDDYDEGIEGDFDTKELDRILEICYQRIKSPSPESHYKAVCRALVTEATDLKVFLENVLQGGTEKLRISADAQTSKQELEKLGFNDWARCWMQVLDQLRQGIRLKNCTYTRAPIEYELTPYEMLMADIRAKNYRLRKIMINGQIPQRVKNDAHAIILEFIRSRPPLKKASERQLLPLQKSLCAREELMQSIRQCPKLRSINIKSKVLTLSQGENVRQVEGSSEQRRAESQQNRAKEGSSSTTSSPVLNRSSSPAQNRSEMSTLTRNKQRRIEVDYSLFQDDDFISLPSTSSSSANSSMVHDNKNITKENDQNVHNVVPLRRPTDLDTSRRASYSSRRHTIVGCHQDDPDNPNPSTEPVVLEEQQLANKSASSKPKDEEGEEVTNENDNRLSLTLEEIVHIRSVMTKAELESLPIEVRIKEDVERRKVCFLCLKTRFSIFGPWGVQCKLCRKTICSKCYTKMKIPADHFRNVPVVLLSPSLISSPATSGTSSPCHSAGQYNYPQNMHDIDSFPKSLMERLMRPETDQKTRWAIGSAPASPRHHLSSNSSTPGIITEHMATLSLYQPEAHSIVTSCAKDKSMNSLMTRSMEGPRSLPLQSPARAHSVSNTLERRNRFPLLTAEQKENMRGELMAVCNDCRGLVLEIIRSSRQQTRSSARNKAIKNLTLDLTPIYKPC